METQVVYLKEVCCITGIHIETVHSTGINLTIILINIYTEQKIAYSVSEEENRNQ